jgi:hypothetical protein
MPSPIVDVIKNRVRQAVNEVLTNAADGRTRPARVTVVRTVRRGRSQGGGETAFVKAYRLLEDLKVLVGDLDRVVLEAKSFFPAKRSKSSTSKGSKGSKGAKSKRSSKKSASGRGRSAAAGESRGGKRRRRTSSGRGGRRPTSVVERTTLDAETPVRRAV